ncbi:MAG: hypothetical protein ABIP77_01865 [Candidatus Limnocylindrales bacterium]
MRRQGSASFIAGASIIALGLLASLPGLSRAASTTVNLDQWASSDAAWQNGNLNGNNSRYPEGGVVPFRLAIEGLTAGDHSIHINYDFTAGGHKAYDFLATWNITDAAGAICASSGGGISSMCPALPASSSATFPSDGYVANGLAVRGAEAYSGTPRELTIWGGTITDIAGPVHAGSPDGNSSGDFLVQFRASGPAVLLAWGGRLAQSDYWDLAVGGPADGAGQVSGAPWHMRTLQLDGTGNKNQDRSIQPSAIVGSLPPSALAPVPPPTPVPTPAAPVQTSAPTTVPTAAAPVPTAPQVTPGAATPATPRSGTTGGGTPGIRNPRLPAAPVLSPGPRLTPPATSTWQVPDGGRSAPSPQSILIVLIVLTALAGASLHRWHRRRYDRAD